MPSAEPGGRRAAVETVAIFVATRLVLLAIGLTAAAVLPPYDRMWRFIPNEPLTGIRALDLWVKWDSAWYLRLARTGYAGVDYQVMSPIDAAGFFPLYPAALHALTLAIGSPIVAGLLISNLAGLAACLVFYRLVRLDFPHDIASRTVLFLCAFPTSFYLSAVATESLFLLLTLLSVHAWRLRRHGLAVAWAALAAVCRPVGILLVVLLAIESLSARDQPMGRRMRQGALLLVPCLALGAFAWLCWSTFGDPLAFVRRQELWRGAMRWPWLPFMAFIERPHLYNGSFSALEPLIALGLLLSVALTSRQLPASYVAYAAVGLVVPLLTGFDSYSRYALTVFPACMALALLSRSVAIERSLLVMSLVTLGLYMAVFATGTWIA